MAWKDKLPDLAKFKNLNLKRIAGSKWKEEKLKAAGLLKALEPVNKPVVRQMMKRNWYRHIDKALDSKTTSHDAKHWKRMAKNFKKEITGKPTQETLDILEWLEDFAWRVERNGIGSQDMKKWLPQFRSYMESCEKNAMNIYIEKSKLMEV